MSSVRFDELIHPSTRLGIVSLLAAAQWADFKFIRDTRGTVRLRTVQATDHPAGGRLRADPQRIRRQTTPHLSHAYSRRRARQVGSNQTPHSQ
jgi:hypothetical protein